MSMIFTILFALAGFSIAMYVLWWIGWGKSKGSWTGVVEEKNRVFLPKQRVYRSDEWDVTLYIRTDKNRRVTINFLESEVKNSVKRIDVGDRVKKVEGEDYPVRL